MSEMKHTPGPWGINKYGGIGAGKFFCNPCIVDSTGWDDAAPGDMRLIAASPTMLDALQKALVAFNSSKHFLEYAHPDTAKEFTDAWDATEKAIAEASGSASAQEDQ